MSVVPMFKESPPPEVGIPNQEAIDDLRKFLEMAERGELQGFAMAFTRSDGNITTVIQTNGEHFAMSHAIGALWFRFQQQMAETSRSDL